MYVCVYIPSTKVDVRVKMLKTYYYYDLILYYIRVPGYTGMCCVVCFIFLIVLFECFILSNFTYCFKLFVFLLHFYSVARMHLMLCAFCLFTCCFCCSIVWPDVQLSLVFKELVPLTFSVPTHAADLPMIAIPRPPSSSFQGLESLELCCSGHQDHD